MSYWPTDYRLFHCKYCNMKQKFNVNIQNDKDGLELWNEYHAKCKERMEEQAIIRAMRMKNKSLIPYFGITEYEIKQSEQI